MKRTSKQSSKRVSASDRQVGGSHYKDMAIQPAEYSTANRIGYLEGAVIKYVSRHPNKGKAEDIRKAIHACHLILEFQYGENAAQD